ncbi:MAG: Hpt domain-containing protein [Gammaproteobacteria bacterium]
MHNKNIIDCSVLLDQLEGDEALWREIIEVFIDDTHNQILAMEEAISRKDVAVVQRIAHTIKGTSGTIGVAGLQEAALKMEQAMADKDVTFQHVLLGAIRHEFEQVRKILDGTP